MVKNWKYFDIRKSFGEEKWTKGNGDKVITLSKGRNSKYWRVITQTISGSGDNSTRFFRTKQSALKYAKSYMRKY